MLPRLTTPPSPPTRGWCLAFIEVAMEQRRITMHTVRRDYYNMYLMAFNHIDGRCFLSLALSCTLMYKYI